MNKKLVIIAAAVLAAALPLFSNSPIVVTADEGDNIPDAANYLRLEGQYTDVAWISGISRERANDDQVRYPIVFFNTNPAWQIQSIEHINFEAKLDGRTQSDFGTVSYNEPFQVNLRQNRQLHVGVPSLEKKYLVQNNYDLDSNHFVTVRNETFFEDVSGWFYYREHYNFSINELGKTQMLKDMFNMAGELKPNLNEYLLWRYKTSSTAWSYYQDMTRDFGSNYEYFLILPFETTTNATITYLSLMATDIYGNTITDDAQVYETGENSWAFEIKKVAGNLITHSAFYFPGSNRYRMTGVLMEDYADESETKDYQVRLYAGNLIGKTAIDAIRESISYSTQLIPDEEKLLSYLFNGDNNSILVDIPDEITDVTVTIRYVKENTELEPIADPFGLNLLDNNGNYGIAGELPLEDDPATGWNLWDWLKSIFAFTGTVSLAQALQQALAIFLGLCLLAGVLWIISKFVIFIRVVAPRKQRK